jgi:hypothetical protein
MLPLALGLGVTLGACEVVDPGPDVGVANRCVVSPNFFVERIVPEYLQRHDCAQADGCHASDSSGSIYRLESTADTLMPLPSDPVAAWPLAWQNNLQSTTFFITDCDIAELSPLYAKPAGGATDLHEGGDIFSANGPELELIQEWLDGS